MIRLFVPILLLIFAQGCGDPRQPTPDIAPDLPTSADLGLDAPVADARLDAAADADAVGNLDAAAEAAADLSLDGPNPDAPPPAAHSLCAGAQVLALGANNAVSIIDSTTWASDEFGGKINCGASAGPWTGPQHYYRVKLTQGLRYRVTLRTGGFDGALYAFPASTACSASAINAACKTSAASGPPLHLFSDNPGASSDELLRLAPAASADWVVVVEGVAPADAGFYKLTVAAVTTPGHAACGAAQVVSFSGEAVTVEGDTSLADNEFGGAVSCGADPLSGPQLYYKVALKTNDKLALTLTPDFPARAYLFPATSCTAAAINAGCSSSGTSGLSLSAAAGATTTAIFTPTAGGDFIVAVDSGAPWAGGPFRLNLRASTPPTNSNCIYAQDLTLDASGAVQVKGDTVGASDEFATLSCGGTTLPGPQVYYKLKQLQAGATYRLLLTPSFAAELYLFSTAAACKLAGIESDCQGAGGKGLRLQSTTAANATRSLYFKPVSGGDYFVAVDSRSNAAAGTFTLDVAQTSAPSNSRCLKAQSVALSAGQAALSGETHGSSDELSGLKCGGFTLLDGPQVYYRVALSAGQPYKLTLAPTFMAQLYLYSPAAAGSCTEGALEHDCASAGVNGLTLGPVAPGAVDAAIFTPAASGSYGLGVDSADATRAGYFDLKVQAYSPPTNGTCAAPAPIPLATSPVVLHGDTTGGHNEFGQAVTCGGTQSYDGPQLYYRLTLKQGTRYTLTLTPQGWDAALYAFANTSCTALAVTGQCALLGLADASGLSGQETLTLTPTTSGDIVVAVDGTTATTGGPFTLSASWK